MFLKKSLPLSELTVTTETERHFIMCDFLMSTFHWRFICLYAPSSVKDLISFFFVVLRRFVDCVRKVVRLGHFNCVVGKTDRSPSRQHTDRTAIVLNKLLEKFDLIDAGNVKNETCEMQFTYFQASSHAWLERFMFRLRSRPAKEVPSHAGFYSGKALAVPWSEAGAVCNRL